MLQHDANGVVLKRYVRGQDLTGSAEVAGGVGSLLAIMQGSGSDYVGYYFADANGNITCMYGTNDQELASYRYNLFGNITNASGSWASQNRYQWSSKENDASTGLVYCLYRFYSPELGRWVNRDPIEEAGGVNLYGMVNNSPSSLFDMWGLDNLNLINKSEIASQMADNRGKGNGEYTVSGHGNSNSISDANGNSVSPKQLAEMIKLDPEYDPSKPVRLNSCSTGKANADGSDNFAQKLAKELKNDVIAPTDDIIVKQVSWKIILTDMKPIFIGTPTTTVKNNGEFKKFPCNP